MAPDPFATDGGTAYPIGHDELDARKRSVYVAFLAMGAAGALFSFALNLVRTTPDPAAGWIQLTLSVVLGVGVVLVGWWRVALAAAERAMAAIGALGILGSIGWSLYGPTSVALGRAAVQATLPWVPLVFVFGFVAFRARAASRLAIGLLGAIAVLVVPHDLAAVRSGVSNEAFTFVQVFVGYALLIAGLRFFTDLHVRASSLAGTAERMREAAHTDALTGLGNRRQAELWLSRDLQRAARYARQFSVLMLDLDQFRRLNEVHGRAAGDRVLADLASELTGMVRASDAVVRWGGEAFLVLAPETGLDDAVQVAELIRRQVATLPLGDGHRITVSVGVATHRSGDDAERLVARADAALYMAKRSGRNAVRQEIAPPS